MKTASTLLSFLALAFSAGAACAQSTLADPFKDSRYMSGFRDVAPSAVPEELRDADTLARIQGTRRISACGDPYSFPSTEITDEARGYDVDLLRRIAAEQGWDVQFVWVNTVNRGGLNRAFRTTIRTGSCDVFLGLSTGGMDEALKKSKLVLIEPTFAVRYVLITFDPALAGHTLARFANEGTVVGATYFSPAEKLLEAEGLKREAFPEARRAIQALAEGRVAAALIPSTSVAEARRAYPDRTVHVVENFVPADAASWNNTWAVRQKDDSLKAFLEQRIAAMRQSGEMEALLQRYGIPYYAPVAAVTGALR